MIRGYIEGAKAALLHNVADMARDVVVKSTGTNMANLAEAGLDYVLTRNEQEKIKSRNARGWNGRF